jgi:peptidoglycan/LPS O-acetylase OafA/YrhL
MVGAAAIFAAAGTIVVMHASSDRSVVTRVFAWRPLVAIGVVSYGIYLWHYAMFRTFGLYPGLVATAIIVPLSWRYLERPILHGFKKGASSDPRYRIRGRRGVRLPARATGALGRARTD